jgi:hypothetical protein
MNPRPILPSIVSAGFSKSIEDFAQATLLKSPTTTGIGVLFYFFFAYSNHAL